MKNTTPAVLLYYNDLLAATTEMNDAEFGMYVKLLCMQNIKGHMSLDCMKRICPGVNEYVLEKFVQDEDGLYYNKRMEFEIERRVNFSKSRSKNRSKKTSEKDMKNISSTSEEDMETETETYIDNTTSNSNNNPPTPLTGIAVEVIDYLNERAGTRYRATSQATKAKIQARLNEGYSVDDFKIVIDKKCAEWIGTEHEKYLRPETLFGPKFEGYLNQKTSGHTKNKFAAMLGVSV